MVTERSRITSDSFTILSILEITPVFCASREATNFTRSHAILSNGNVEYCHGLSVRSPLVVEAFCNVSLTVVACSVAVSEALQDDA